MTTGKTVHEIGMCTILRSDLLVMTLTTTVMMMPLMIMVLIMMIIENEQ